MNISLQPDTISKERIEVLQAVIDYIQSTIQSGKTPNLNFICTHNSRRSQLAQIWAQIAAQENGVEVNCFSGGVEVTAFNHRAVKALETQGINFSIENKDSDNPIYTYRNDDKEMKLFSKLFDDDSNPTSNFAAIMTCSHADENCPFIPGAEARIPLRYDDPKAFDDLPNEQEKYTERSEQIANEMFYIFSHLN